jgi:DNA-binding transcriptional LysR family regulator
VRGFGDRFPTEALAQGELDLAIGFFGDSPEGFFLEKLFSERFVCMAGRDQPRFRKRRLLDDYIAARHVLISLQGGGFVGIVDRTLAKTKLKRDVMCSM